MRRLTATRVYLLNGLIRRACRGGFWPLFFVRLVTEVNLSPFQLVVLGTVMELTILTMEIPTGVVADVYSRKWSIVISFFVMGLAFVASGFVEPFWLLVLTQIMIGFGNTFETGAETAWITSEVGSSAKVEPVILRRARLQLIAGIVGIVVFGALAAVTTLTISLMTIGIIFTTWGLVLANIMSERNFVRVQGEGWSEFMHMLRSGLAQTRSVRSLRLLATAMFVFGLAKEAIDRLDVQRLVDIGLPTEFDEVVIVAVITAVKLGLAALLLLIASTKAKGSGVVGAFVFALLGMAIGVVALAHSEFLVIAALGLSLQGGLSYAMEPLVTTWANTFASDDARATVHSFMGQGEAFGEILGGVALGAVAQVFSVPTAMTMSAILFVIAAMTAGQAKSTWVGDGG